MRDELIRSFAADHGLPLSHVREFALTIAEQCALLANRFEAEGELECVDVATVEAVGAEIGAAKYADQLAAAHAEIATFKETAKAEKVSAAIGKAIRERSQPMAQ